MRMFDRDRREEAAEVEDTIHPKPERPKPLSVAELILLLQHEEQDSLVDFEGQYITGVGNLGLISSHYNTGRLALLSEGS